MFLFYMTVGVCVWMEPVGVRVWMEPVGVCVWMEPVGVCPRVQAVECVSFASQLTSAEMKKACLMALDAAMVK